jgi:hypothetical protein
MRDLKLYNRARATLSLIKDYPTTHHLQASLILCDGPIKRTEVYGSVVYTTWVQHEQKCLLTRKKP